MAKLDLDFYQDSDVVGISRRLLGKVLCTRIGGSPTQVIITETEAYAGIEDRASHAFGGRRTARTEPMYASGGTAYVYLCYGIHHLFNVVTNVENVPHAVLIRAGAPVKGLETMLARRGRERNDKTLLAGPGSLAKALGITTADTGTSLMNGSIWIEDRGIGVPDDAVTIGARVGVDYAGDDAQRPYRFIADAKALSPD